jgi:hypothetical protein
MWPTCTLLNSNLAPCPSRLARIRAHARLDSLALTGPRPTDTNIGIDDRNQFDLFRAMPGGLDGVKRVTEELHQAGVKVLWPYNPWDTGTSREPVSDEDTFAILLKQTGGDGFNGDTMDFVPESFYKAAEKLHYPLAFEPEGGGKDDHSLNWSTMGWGYWSYPTAPSATRVEPCATVSCGLCTQRPSCGAGWSRDQSGSRAASSW